MRGLWSEIKPLTVYSTYRRLTNQTMVITKVQLEFGSS